MFFQTLARLFQKLLPHCAGRATRRRRSAMQVPAECLELRRLLSVTNAVQVDDAPETTAVEVDANGTGNEMQTASGDLAAFKSLNCGSADGTQAFQASAKAVAFGGATERASWTEPTKNAASLRADNDSVIESSDNSRSDEVSDRSARIEIDVIRSDDRQMLAENFTDQGQIFLTVEPHSAVPRDQDDSTANERGDRAVGIESIFASKGADGPQRDAVPDEIESRAGSDAVAEIVWETDRVTPNSPAKYHLAETVQKPADTQAVAAELAMPDFGTMWLASKVHGSTAAVGARLPNHRAANQSTLLQLLFAGTGNLTIEFGGESGGRVDDVASSGSPKLAPESVPLGLGLDGDELPKVDAVASTLARLCRSPDLFGD